jgi:hypothetical protein
MNAAGENVPAGKNIEKKVACWWQGGRKTKMAHKKKLGIIYVTMIGLVKIIENAFWQFFKFI